MTNTNANAKTFATFESNAKPIVENGYSFAHLVLTAIAAFLGTSMAKTRLTESTKTGDYKISHPVIALQRFLRSLGNGENKSERERLVAEKVKDGMSLFDATEHAKTMVKRNFENGRVDSVILQRIANTATERGLTHIVLTVAMEKKLISLLKNSVDYDGHVTTAMLNEVLPQLAAVFAQAENSSVSCEDLGIGMPVQSAVISAKDELKAAKAPKLSTEA